MSGGIAVVTGGARGIGAAIVDALLADGYEVAIVARDPARVRPEVADSPATQLVAADLAVPDDVERAAREVRAGLGAPSVLVNNAGGWVGTPLAELEQRQVVELCNVIVTGTLLTTRAFLPDLAAAAAATIVNIGSTSALPAYRDSVVAATTKAAVVRMTETLRYELPPSVRVSVVHPAAVASAGGGGGPGSLSAADVAEVVRWILSRPPHVELRDVVVAPSANGRS